MTASLVDRVTAFVAANPGLTLEEIARGVVARTADVRDVLSATSFSASVRDENVARSPQVYRIAPEGADDLGRRARASQCQLIAHVLRDGNPHTTAEIHRRCGYSRLNSRIAELRNPERPYGMVIRCDHVEGKSSGPDAQTYTFLGYLPGFGPTGRIGTSSETTGESALPASASSVVSPDASVQHDSLPGSSVADDSTGHAGASDSQFEFGEAA